MGQVCENCGWRTKDGECIFTNPKTKRLWKKDAYNDPCENYIMDITLREHIKSILNTPSDREERAETRWSKTKNEEETIKEMLNTVRHISDLLKDKEKITLFYDWVVRGSLYSEAPDDALSIVLGLDYLEEELMWL